MKTVLAIIGVAAFIYGGVFAALAAADAFKAAVATHHARVNV